jgi:uncharacterized membrane protein YcaP (DUF421 family)
MDSLLAIFGKGRDLDVLQMCVRTVVVFVLVLVAVRLAGRRSFGQRSPFDLVVTILLGAIISRAVVGVSPFIPTMMSGFTLVFLHRAVAWLTVVLPSIDKILNGSERIILSGGAPDERQMRKALINHHDLFESARLHGKLDFSNYDLMILERSGRISVIKRDD